MTFPQAPGFPGFPPGAMPQGYPAPGFPPNAAAPGFVPGPPAAAPQPIMGGNPMAAVLAALNQAKTGNVSSRRLPDVPAAYIVEVGTAEIKRTPRHGIMGFVGFKVLESSNPAVAPGSEHDWGRGLEPGNDQYEYGRNDIRGWIVAAVEHLSPGAAAQWNEQFTPAIFAVEPATADNGHPQPMRGSHWLVVVRSKPKKQSAGETWVTDWQPVPKGTTLASLGFGAAPAQPVAMPAAPAFTPPAAPPGMYVPTPATPPTFTPTPLAATASPPPGWPPGLPWSPPR